MILAAPVAFIAGIGRAARAGVVVKNGTALKMLSRVRTVAFDKTGTLTRGAPVVTGTHPVTGVSDDELLSIAAAVESYSSHVLAGAVVAAARSRNLPLAPADHVEEVPAGVCAAA